MWMRGCVEEAGAEGVEGGDGLMLLRRAAWSCFFGEKAPARTAEKDDLWFSTSPASKHHLSYAQLRKHHLLYAQLRSQLLYPSEDAHTHRRTFIYSYLITRIQGTYAHRIYPYGAHAHASLYASGFRV